MMPLKNLLYLFQLEEYDLKRFGNWLKSNPNRIVLEKKKRIDWTLKAQILFALACILNVFSLRKHPTKMLKIAFYIFLPLDWFVKKILILSARIKISRIKNLTTVGITGSYGKTTIKNIIAHILTHKYETLKTEGNRNTLLGVAETILKNLKSKHEIFIAEMSAYQPGDIKSIAKLAKPKIGIITAIGPVHLERFKSMENILKTKLELIESLPEDGIGFLPKELESRFIKYLRNSHHGSKKITAKIEYFSSKEDLIIKIGKVFGMSEEKISEYIKTAPSTPHRQQIIKTSTNITIIDDTYNSNPIGFISALELLKNASAQRKILVTPGMIELGEKQFELNKNAAMLAAQIADYVIIVGETNKHALEEGLKEGFNLSGRTSGLEDSYEDKEYNKLVFEVASLEEAKSKLSELAIPNSAILFENDLPDHYF